MPMWSPQSESELLTALAGRTVDEGHYLEFKRTTGESEGERKETARDLASFAIDGGVIVFGVDEVADGVFEPAPTEIASLSERVEQVAANRVEPGLHVRTRALKSATTEGLGYLVVEIPPSPSSPHMVDGRYWGRSEKTKRRLADAEVVRLHAARVDTEDLVRRALLEELERAPEARPRIRAHLVAEPLSPNPDLARSFTRQNANVMLQFASSAEDFVPDDVREWAPLPHELSAVSRRAMGIARTNLDEGRTVKDEWLTSHATDIEVRTSGSIRILLSRLSSTSQDRRQADVERTMLFDAALIAWAYRAVRLAANLASEVNYYGPWGFGIHVDGLAGATTWVKDDFAIYRLATYEASSYERVTTASLGELSDDSASVVGRLLEDLMLALGSDGRYREHLGQVSSG